MALTKQKSFADGAGDASSSECFLSRSPPFPATATVLVVPSPSPQLGLSFSSCAPSDSTAVSGTLWPHKEGRGTQTQMIRVFGMHRRLYRRRWDILHEDRLNARRERR